MPYYIKNAGGTRYDLPSSLRPGLFAPATRSPNLYRARGYLTVYDLSDGLPDPVPITLSGMVTAAHEDALSSLLTDLQYRLNAAVKLGRTSSVTPSSTRWEIDVLGGSMIAVPVSDDATDAELTLTLIPAQVPDPSSLSAYW